MTAAWPKIAVWIKAEHQWGQVRFTDTPGWVCVQVPLNRERDAIAHLALVTCTAVEQITGVAPYERAHTALNSADPPYLPEKRYHRAWPRLPFIAYRNRKGVVKGPVIGARKHAERPGTVAYTRGANVVPYPSELAVIRKLDAAVREVACRITGRDSFVEALDVLTKPKPSASKPVGWRSEPIGERIPDWSHGGPRTMSGGLPGLGKNHRY
ncbi:hypothetical protein GCM10023178_04900 [Actinomadura luteofluorescens]